MNIDVFREPELLTLPCPSIRLSFTPLRIKVLLVNTFLFRQFSKYTCPAPYLRFRPTIAGVDAAFLASLSAFSLSLQAYMTWWHGSDFVLSSSTGRAFARYCRSFYRKAGLPQNINQLWVQDTQHSTFYVSCASSFLFPYFIRWACLLFFS